MGEKTHKLKWGWRVKFKEAKKLSSLCTHTTTTATTTNDEFEDNFEFKNNAINYIEQSAIVETWKIRHTLSIFAWKLLFKTQQHGRRRGGKKTNKQAYTCEIVNLHWHSLHQYMQFFLMSSTKTMFETKNISDKNKQKPNRSRYNLTATHTQVSRCKTNRNQIKIQPNEYKKEKNGLKMSVCANVRARVSAFIRLNNYRKVPRLVELHKYFYFYFLFWLLFEFIRLCCFFSARRCTIRKIR